MEQWCEYLRSNGNGKSAIFFATMMKAHLLLSVAIRTAFPSIEAEKGESFRKILKLSLEKIITLR